MIVLDPLGLYLRARRDWPAVAALDLLVNVPVGVIMLAAATWRRCSRDRPGRLELAGDVLVRNAAAQTSVLTLVRREVTDGVLIALLGAAGVLPVRHGVASAPLGS